MALGWKAVWPGEQVVYIGWGDVPIDIFTQRQFFQQIFQIVIRTQVILLPQSL